MPGQALKGPGAALRARAEIDIAFQGLIGIERVGVRLFPRLLDRTLVHMAVDQMDKVNRFAIGAIDIALPIPETVRIKIIDGVARLAVHVFFAPDDVTH
jgi:hypothetical protein